MEYLTISKKIQESLKPYGFFRKNKYVIRKTTSEAYLEFFINQRLDKIRHMIFCEIGVGITYRKVVRLKKEHGLYVGIPEGLSTNIGYLMPECTYIEVSLGDVDNPQTTSAIDHICLLMKEYAIPFMEMYSNPQRLILSYERNELAFIHINRQLLVLLYFLYEDKEKAMIYVSEQINLFRETHSVVPSMNIEHHRETNNESINIIVHGDELKIFEELQSFMIRSFK